MGEWRTSENVYVAILSLFGLAVAVITDHAGMPQKWHAAIVGTLVAFSGCAWVFRSRWSKPEFWLALGTCFVLHLFGIWFVFAQLLSEAKNFGILIWAPVAFVEAVFLLGLVPALQRKIHSLEHPR
jgi:1,4-dihydroxy-2-naphthoate octaprenyltransferase